MSDLPRLAMIVAEDLEHRGYKAAGVVRQLAREAVALRQALADRDAALGRRWADAADGISCPACGAEVPKNSTGRPRRYCSDRCRKAHARRKSRNETVEP